MIEKLADQIYKETIKDLEEDYTNEKDWIDEFKSVMEFNWNLLINDINHHLEFHRPYIERKIRWKIADKFGDDGLVNDLIEEEIALQERSYGEFISSQE